MAIGRLSMKVGKAGKAGPHAAYIAREGQYASRLERGLPLAQTLFDAYPFTVVSLDYIKSDTRRAACDTDGTVNPPSVALMLHTAPASP